MLDKYRQPNRPTFSHGERLAEVALARSGEKLRRIKAVQCSESICVTLFVTSNLLIESVQVQIDRGEST